MCEFHNYSPASPDGADQFILDTPVMRRFIAAVNEARATAPDTHAAIARFPRHNRTARAMIRRVISVQGALAVSQYPIVVAQSGKRPSHRRDCRGAAVRYPRFSTPLASGSRRSATILPPLMTSAIVSRSCRIVTSASGSPSTRTKSAKRPGAISPTSG